MHWFECSQSQKSVKLLHDTSLIQPSFDTYVIPKWKVHLAECGGNSSREYFKYENKVLDKWFPHGETWHAAWIYEWHFSHCCVHHWHWNVWDGNHSSSSRLLDKMERNQMQHKQRVCLSRHLFPCYVKLGGNTFGSNNESSNISNYFWQIKANQSKE